MLLSEFTSDRPAGAGTLIGGTDVFYVGATLSIAGHQPAGRYLGTMEATVNYE